MAFSTHQTGRTAATGGGLAAGRSGNGRDPVSPLGEPDWGETEKPARDWKKLILVIGLGGLSWVATYVGMLELIEANIGDLPLLHKAIIGFSVGMLMIMVVWLLDEMFKPNPFTIKVLYAAGYLFLTLISVGFGFGFYWKVLESRGESTRSAESAVGQVQGSLTAASARLDQLQSTLDQLTAISLQKAQAERATGTSCPASKPGDGPRRKLREDDASRFSFASDFVKGRASAVKTEMSALDGDLVKISAADPSTIDAKTGTRNAFMQAIGRKLDGTVTNFNAFRTDPQLKQIRLDLAERAEKATFPDGAGKTFSCPDGQLQTALRGVVRAIDGLPELEKPKIAAVEGSEATIEAFRRLVASFTGLLQFKLPPSADELRELQKKAIQSVESPAAATAARLNEQPGLSKRDYVPLAVAVFVDLCLLLVSMGRSHDRLSGLVPKMRAAERGPVIQILSRFNDIHRDRQIRENFDLFRHVVFDFHGDYYVAVPLDAPRRMNPHEREELRLEAQLLSNLFASFEKERLFTRVYSPLLMTGTVRKRLARQGSKFAASEAFRIYRFKDGAWSDIILGAVMGAARRVEAEKRMLAIRADEMERNTPLPDPAYLNPALDHRLAQASLGRDGHQPNVAAAKGPATGRGRHGSSDHSDPLTAHQTATGDTDLSRQFGTYAPFVGRSPPAQPDNVHPLPFRPVEPAGQAMFDEPSFAHPGFAQPGFANSGRDLRPANSNTATSGRREHRADLSNVGAPGPEIAVAPGSSQSVGPVADIVPFSPLSASRGSAQVNDQQGDVSAALASAYVSSRTSAALALPLETAAEVSPSASPSPSQPDRVFAKPVDLAPVNLPTASGSPLEWQQQLGIVMTRVTESITVPMSGPVSSPAELPKALTQVGFYGPARELASVTEVEAKAIPRPELIDWNEADTAIAKRYASQPGE